MTQPVPQSPSAFDLAVLAASIAEDKKASDITVLETGKVSYLAEYFIVCSADSTTQVRAIAEAIHSGFKKLGLSAPPWDQKNTSKWLLLDFGDVVVHIFHRQERQFYQLEQFWNHARQVSREQWETRRAS